jgi:hypothetical protein
MPTGLLTCGQCIHSATEYSSIVRERLFPNRSLLTFSVAPRLGLKIDQEAVNSVTRGLVGDTSFAVLPDIVPLTCFLLTLGTQIVSFFGRMCVHS